MESVQQILDRMGFGPSKDRCLDCGQPLTGGGDSTWHGCDRYDKGRLDGQEAELADYREAMGLDQDDDE